jgi:hypothetical protein
MVIIAQGPVYAPPILGIDPGKEGGFCLMSADGKVKRFWRMPLTGGKVCGVQLAALYHKIKDMCLLPPRCFVEKVQARPTDGRVGMASYFKGAGLLEMPVLWGWSFVHVTPPSWCAKMHAGIDKKLHPKEKSRSYISQHWPELYTPGSPIWPPRMKKPHEGIQDALMIAEYARRFHS